MMTPPAQNAASRNEAWTDKQVEEWISVILRTGVLIAAIVGVAGLAATLATQGGQAVHDSVFHGEPADLRSIEGVVFDAWNLNSRGVVQLAIILLLLTPVARVGFSIVAFAAQRDGMYVLVTCIVLVTLLFSILAK
jgi:uncharacterized membrane protein